MERGRERDRREGGSVLRQGGEKNKGKKGSGNAEGKTIEEQRDAGKEGESKEA